MASQLYTWIGLHIQLQGPGDAKFTGICHLTTGIPVALVCADIKIRSGPNHLNYFHCDPKRYRKRKMKQVFGCSLYESVCEVSRTITGIGKLE